MTGKYRLLTHFWGWLGILCLTAAQAFALSTDKNQPAIIDADGVEMDFRTGIRTYTGNVTVKQGSLLIRADKIVVRYKDEKLQTATAYGKPATFKQRPDGKTEDVRGRAPKMVLDEIGRRLHMYQSATLIQGKDEIHSKEIHYNMDTSKMIVKGGAAPAEGKKAGRARIVIQPKSQKSTAPQGPPAP